MILVRIEKMKFVDQLGMSRSFTGLQIQKNKFGVAC
jgi:hypothetical protein